MFLFITKALPRSSELIVNRNVDNGHPWLFFLIVFTDDYDVRGRLSIYVLYYIAGTSSYFYIVEYFCHERLENLLDTL